MLNIDDLALVVQAAMYHVGGIPEQEMTDEDRRTIAAIQHINTFGEAAEEDLPVDKITKRRGDWTQTRSGRRFFAFDAQPSDIDLTDIAFGLANIARFGGQAPFYPVAVHTMRVADVASCIARRRGMLPDDVQLCRAYAILHDASEGYVGDVPAPHKRHLKRYLEMEGMIMGAIHARFQLPPIPPEIEDVVRAADVLVLLIEAEELFPETYHLWAVASLPHAELDAEVRAAAALSPAVQHALGVVRKVLRPFADTLSEAMIQLDVWVQAQADQHEAPETQAPSGTSSWRDEIKQVDLR